MLHARLPLYLDLIRWDRPAGWLLLLWPTLAALWMAAGGFPGWHLLAVFVLGTVLMRSAGCCVNDVADREFDRHVKRTAQRPVTRGAVSPRQALLLGAVLALIAFMLVLTTNALTIGLSFAAAAPTCTKNSAATCGPRSPRASTSTVWRPSVGSSRLAQRKSPASPRAGRW